MTLLTTAEYADVLAERAAAWQQDNPSRLGAPPLIEWFIEDADVDLVDMDAIDAANAAETEQPVREKQPRRYLPAAHWRAQLAPIDARLAALGGYQRHGTDDIAAYAGIGIRQTPRQRQRYGARIDATAAEAVRLTARRADIVRKLRAAELREQGMP